MKAYPHFQKRITHDLNRLWAFKFLDSVTFEAIQPESIQYDDRLPVPSCFDAFPAYIGKRGLGIYRSFVEVTPHQESVLKIGGAGISCKVYVDGLLLGTHFGTYAPFDFKVPASPRSRREIVVVTDNRYDFERCPLHENYFDFYNYGGIIRQVWLEELPAHPIRLVHVIIEDWVTGKIRGKVDFENTPVPVTFTIDGETYQTADLKTLEPHLAEFTAVVANPTPWNIETPNLHELTVDTGSDSITTRFGLRQVKTESGKILLNDEPLKLLGYCRHECHPLFGAATSETVMVADLQLLKGMGCNFVRGSHYQQDPRFLDLCDEMGLVVFSESTGWQQGSDKLVMQPLIEAQLDQTRAMVVTDFNHPSIIMWGFLNEGASEVESSRGCYSMLIELVRRLDPTRLVTYASCRMLNDLFLDLIDVVSFNIYPGWYSPDLKDEYPLGEVIPKIHELIEGVQKIGGAGKPFVISEIGGAAIYGCRDEFGGFWSEQYQSELLRIICQETVSNPKIAGLSIWQFTDMRTMRGAGALGRPRGFNNKGTFDEYRRPKQAYATVKSIFTESNLATD